MTIDTIPSFSRVEIATRTRQDLLLASAELRKLADELDSVAGQHDEAAAVILAHHKIRATSKKLRGQP